jgi:hypothetical protein
MVATRRTDASGQKATSTCFGRVDLRDRFSL